MESTLTLLSDIYSVFSNRLTEVHACSLQHNWRNLCSWMLTSGKQLLTSGKFSDKQWDSAEQRLICNCREVLMGSKFGRKVRMKCLKGLERAIWFFGHGTYNADPVQKS